MKTKGRRRSTNLADMRPKVEVAAEDRLKPFTSIDKAPVNYDWNQTSSVLKSNAYKKASGRSDF